MKANEIENFTVTTSKREAKAGELVNYQSHKIQEKRQRKPHQFIFFESIGEMVNCVHENDFIRNGGNGTFDGKGHNGIDGSPEKGSNGSGNDWTFGKDYPNKEKTKDGLTNGIAPDHLLKLVDQTKLGLYDRHPELFELERTATRMKRKRSYGESGDELNIDRYMSGDPQMWQYMSRRPQKNTIKIMLNLGMNGGCESNKFIDNMVLVASMIDIISMSGISTELWYAPVGYNTTHETNTSGIFAKMKSGEQPLDISRMISCGSAGLFRYYQFKLFTNILDGMPASELGSACNNTPQWIKDMYGFDVCIDAGANENDVVRIFTDVIKKL